MLIEFSSPFYRPQFDFSSAYRTWSLITTTILENKFRETRVIHTRVWICIFVGAKLEQGGIEFSENLTWQQIFQRRNEGEWEEEQLVFAPYENLDSSHRTCTRGARETRTWASSFARSNFAPLVVRATVSPAPFPKFNLPTRETTSIPASPPVLFFFFFFLSSFFSLSKSIVEFILWIRICVRSLRIALYECMHERAHTWNNAVGITCSEIHRVARSNDRENITGARVTGKMEYGKIEGEE